MQSFVRDLNRFYLSEPAFYDNDDSAESFRWTVPSDKKQNVFAFERISKAGERVLCVFNLSPVSRSGYKIGVPKKGAYKAVLDSENKEYGGARGETRVTAVKGESHGYPYHLTLEIAAYSAVYYKIIP